MLSPLTQMLFDNSQAGANAVIKPTILFGQTLTTQALALIPAFSITQVQALVGRGSHLDRMFQRYFALDQQGPIYIVPLADAAGSAAAVGAITFNGTATAGGAIAAYIAGQRVATTVNPGDTAVAIAANVVASINANLDLPVVALAVAATDATLRKVQLTARNAGALGNGTGIGFNYQGARAGEILPAGVSATITAMTGGATDPDMGAAFAMVGDAPGRFFVHPYAVSGMTAVAAALNFSGGRWSPTRKSYGHAFTAISLATTALVTYAAGHDDPHTSVFAYELNALTPVWEAAAIWAGAMAISLRNQPNQPVQTLPLVGFQPANQQPDTAGGPFGALTRETLLGVGLGVARYDRGTPQIVRAVTTYTTNALGSPDQSYQDTEDLYTLMEIADRIETAEDQTFARALLATDDIKAAPGLPIVTPRGFVAFMAALYNQMEFDGLVDNAAGFIDASSAVADLVTAGQLNVIWAPFLVVGLRQIVNTIQFRKLSAAATAVTGS